MPRRSGWLVVGAAVIVIAAIVGWVTWTAHQVWRDLDHVADDFVTPPGFSELKRVRSGTAFCWVTCTNGGEAVTTVVFDPGALPVEEACDLMKEAVRELVDNAGSELEPSVESYYECDFRGPLKGTMLIAGVVARAEDLATDDATRWLDDEAVPDVPVVAWVEVNSGIE